MTFLFLSVKVIAEDFSVFYLHKNGTFSSINKIDSKLSLPNENFQKVTVIGLVQRSGVFCFKKDDGINAGNLINFCGSKTLLNGSMSGRYIHLWRDSKVMIFNLKQGDKIFDELILLDGDIIYRGGTRGLMSMEEAPQQKNKNQPKK